MARLRLSPAPVRCCKLCAMNSLGRAPLITCRCAQLRVFRADNGIQYLRMLKEGGEESIGAILLGHDVISGDRKTALTASELWQVSWLLAHTRLQPDCWELSTLFVPAGPCRPKCIGSRSSCANPRPSLCFLPSLMVPMFHSLSMELYGHRWLALSSRTPFGTTP